MRDDWGVKWVLAQNQAGREVSLCTTSTASIVRVAINQRSQIDDGRRPEQLAVNLPRIIGNLLLGFCLSNIHRPARCPEVQAPGTASQKEERNTKDDDTAAR